MIRSKLSLGVELACVLAVVGTAWCGEKAKLSYDDFASPGESCRPCHAQIYREWQQSMMSKSFTHEWDEIEYFKLALPQALKLEKVSGVKAGCIGCHGPLAFLTGDIPPKPVAAGTRVNEGVSCEVCHNIRGTNEPVPFNFNYIVKVDGTKTSPRKDSSTQHHGIAYSDFLRSPELCATCHDEQDPYGVWVKETYREWRAGPYAKAGVRCQDCHMHHAPGMSSSGGKECPDIAHHVFHGSHVQSKLAGAVDLALYPTKEKAAAGSPFVVRAILFNGKAGHQVPSGSAEERILWLEVWAEGSNGTRQHVPVDRRNFPGEEHTIADAKAIAYNDIGEIMGLEGFTGLSRDGDVPDGARIFRRPFFDPKGRMTICQWYTEKNTLVDYRIGPRQTRIEEYTWNVPGELRRGRVTFKARLLYSQVPSSIGKFFKLPADEYQPLVVNETALTVDVE